MPDVSENNQQDITEVITPFLEDASDDMSSIKEDISSIQDSVTSVSDAIAGNQDSIASNSAVIGSYYFEVTTNSEGLHTLWAKPNFFIRVDPSNSSASIKSQGLKSKSLNSSSLGSGDMLCRLNDDGSVSDWFSGAEKLIFYQVIFSDSSVIESNVTTVYDLVTQYQHIYHPELFLSVTSSSSDVVLTRDETLQGMGDFSFLMVAIVAVLLLNLGVNLFRVFRSR